MNAMPWISAYPREQTLSRCLQMDRGSQRQSNELLETPLADQRILWLRRPHMSSYSELSQRRERGLKQDSCLRDCPQTHSQKRSRRSNQELKISNSQRQLSGSGSSPPLLALPCLLSTIPWKRSRERWPGIWMKAAVTKS